MAVGRLLTQKPGTVFTGIREMLCLLRGIWLREYRLP